MSLPTRIKEDMYGRFEQCEQETAQADAYQ